MNNAVHAHVPEQQIHQGARLVNLFIQDFLLRLFAKEEGDEKRVGRCIIFVL